MDDDDTVLVPKHIVQQAVDMLVRYMRGLSSERRLEVMDHFCKECGDDDPTCQCWNGD